MLRWLLVGMLALIAIAQIAMAGWLHRNRSDTGAVLMVYTLAIAVFPTAGTAIQTLVPGLALKVLVFTVWTSAIWFLPVLAQAGITAHAGYPHLLTRRVWTVALGFGVVCSGLAATNPLHELFYSDFRLVSAPFPGLVYTRMPLYQVANTVVLLSGLVTALLFVHTLVQSRRWTARQSLLVIGSLTPIGLLLVALTRYTSLPVHPFAVAIGAGTLVIGGILLRNPHLTGESLARQTTMSHIDEGLIVLDTAGDVIEYNESALGFLPALEGTIGESLAEAVPMLWADDRESVSPDGFADRIEIPGGDDLQTIAVTCSPVTVGATTYGYVVTLHDITTQRRYERQLEEQNERLDRFASVVSHDLRNPLNVARLHLERLDSDANEDAVASIDTSLDRMEAIIEDVLALARLEEIDGTATVSLESAALSAWDHVDTGDGTLEITGDPTLQANESRLVQLLENLFRNAIEHGGPAVTVTVSSLAHGFAVGDDGPGIDPDDRTTVFESGYTTNDGGTGLGLDIVETIVDAHGWEVHVSESPAGGAQFEITGVAAGDES